MAVRITCINKAGGYHDDKHEAIRDLGWTNESTGESGKSTRLQMYEFIKDKNGEAYVNDNAGNRAYLVTRISSKGTKFVKTIADGKETDNLLYLPECK